MRTHMIVSALTGFRGVYTHTHADNGRLHERRSKIIRGQQFAFPNTNTRVGHCCLRQRSFNRSTACGHCASRPAAGRLEAVLLAAARVRDARKTRLSFVPNVDHLVAAQNRVQLHPDAAVDLRRSVRIAVAGVRVVIFSFFLFVVVVVLLDAGTFSVRHLGATVPTSAVESNARCRLNNNAHTPL